MQRQMNDTDDISFQVVERVQTDSDHNEPPQNRVNKDHNENNLLCFWVVGFCAGIGGTILSSASFDVIKRLEGTLGNSTEENGANHTRDCIADMPAVLLLANTIPALILKLILPFIPFYIRTNIVSACILSTASFIIVAVSQQKWQAIFGIILTSLSSDLSDITALAYLAKFKDRKRLIVSYSSGIGFSGVAASFFYAALCDIGFTPKTLLFLLLVVPLLGLVAFSFIKESNITRSPSLLDDETGENDSVTSEAPPLSLSEKWRYMPKLTIYFVPMLINCLFEYMVGQTFDLMYVPGTSMNHADQYRWMSAISNFGSLFGRIALSYIWIDDIWALNLLTGTFMAYFMFESLYLTIPNIWVIFIFVFLVEFISDYTILNVFYRLSNETPPHYQVFAVCSISIGITIGVIAAGAIAIPMHDMICKLPPPF